MLLLIITPLQALSAEKNHTDELVFGVLPIANTEVVFKRFLPLADHISRAIGRDIRLETAPDFATFARRTSEKRYDILFTAPHFYYAAQRESGYQVKVRINKPNLQAIFVVPVKSDIKSVADLRGKTVATTSRVALATVMLLNHLKSMGIDADKDLTLVPTPTHNSAMLSAYKGVTDAGGLMYPPYSRAKPELQNGLRIIAKVGDSPNMPIPVASRVDAETADKIKQALVSLGDTEAGRKIMKQYKWPGFVPADPSLYDHMHWSSSAIKTD
jgi:phosphonate transport system substrate-binding protein